MIFRPGFLYLNMGNGNLPVIQVGKNGLSEALIEEIKLQLDKNEKIKVKLLRSSRQEKSKKKMAKEIASRTESELEDLRGFTLVLSKT